MTATTKYDDQLQNKIKAAELLQEQIGLLQRVREIELEIEGSATAAPLVVKTRAIAPKTNAAPVVNATGEVKRRGRPKGSTNVNKAAKLTTPATGVATDDGKSVDLPTLLETIAQQVNRPLFLKDFVTLAREAGYTTKAKDFSNMVYQSVLKLVKTGKFKKNEETRAYEYVVSTAA